MTLLCHSSNNVETLLRVILLGFLRSYFHSESFYGEFNHSFIVLIPKNKAAKELKDFRPISLLSSMYNIISKVLATRLKRVMVQDSLGAVSSCCCGPKRML